MPRIYAKNEAHNMTWGEVDFFNGVAAVPAGTNIAYFTAAGYSVDNSKHVLTLLDYMTPAELRQMCDYLGVSYDAGEAPDTKQTLVRAIETSISTKYLASVTVASEAGTAQGESKITITGEGTYKYKTAKTTPPALLYMDMPDSTWGDIETGDDITPGAPDHDKITVVKVNDDGYVIGLGSTNLTVNQ